MSINYLFKSLLLACLLCPCLQIKAALISFETSTPEVLIGSQFNVDIWIEQLNDDVVSAFDLSVLFNDSQLTIQQVDFGVSLGANIDSLQDTVFSGNKLGIAELSFLFDDELGVLQTGTRLLLASIQYVADGVGETEIGLATADVIGGDFLPIMPEFGEPLRVEIMTQQVSEPNLGLLFFGVILLLILKLNGKTLNEKEWSL